MRGIHSRTLAALAALAALTFVATLGAGAAAADDTTPAPDAAAAAPAVAPDKPALLTDEKLVELVRKADRVLRGRTSAAVVEMQIKTADYDRTYSMVIWDDARDGEKALVKILGPAMWRGYGTLKVGDRLLSYNPRNDHVTVIASSMLGDSWMGSHFTNDDLVRSSRLSEDYAIELVSDVQALAEEIYRFRLTPKPDAPVVWGKMEVTVRRPDLQPLSQRFFDEDEKAVRLLEFSDHKEVDGRVLPMEMAMRPLDGSGEFTRITWKEIDFDVNLDKGFFTLHKLKSM